MTRRPTISELWYAFLPVWSIPLFALLAVAKYRGAVFYDEPDFRWFVTAICGLQVYGLSAFWVCHLLDRSQVTGMRKALWWGIALVAYGVGPTITYFRAYKPNQRAPSCPGEASAAQNGSAR